MPDPSPTAGDDDETAEWTPERVVEAVRSGEDDRAASGFVRLLTPRTRAAILDVLVRERGDPLTVAEMEAEHDEISTSAFARHKDYLIDAGVIEEAGMKGNAMTYQLNTSNPVAQVLAMLDNLLLWGETPALLDERFVSEEDGPTAIVESE